jgi:putative transcriptional regulator
MLAVKQPSPAEIRAAREAARLTQTAAAELVHAELRTWQHWESTADADDRRAMPLASWELFLLKTKGMRRR